MRRFAPPLAAALVLLVAVAAPAAETRRTQLVTQGTSEDVSFPFAGPGALFATDESLTERDDDGGESDLYTRMSGRTTLVSRPTGVPDPGAAVTGVGYSPAGTLFTSAGRFTEDDQDGGRVDLYERRGGVTLLISAADGVPDPDSDDVSLAGVGGTGEFPAVFFSTTQRMTADDVDAGAEDVYVRNYYGQTYLITRGDGDPSTPDADPSPMHMDWAGSSSNGDFVYFTTTASFDPDDADGGRRDVYLRDRWDTHLISRPDAPGPDAAPFDADFEGIKYDASRVFFSTSEPMTVSDKDGTGSDGFVRTSDHTGLVTTGPSDPQTGDAEIDDISFDASHVLFRTAAKMTPTDRDSGRVDAYVRAKGGVTTLVTRPTGVPDPDSDDAGETLMSGSGNVVLFETTERLEPNDRDGGQPDIYRNVYSGETTRVTVPTGVPDPAAPDDVDVSEAAVSSNGSNVFFVTGKRLTPDDRDSGRRDVYVRRPGGTELVSKATGVPPPDSGDATLKPGGYAAPDGFTFATSERLRPADTDGGAIDAYFSNLLPAFTYARFVPKRFRTKDGTSIKYGVSEPAWVTISFRRRGSDRVLGRIHQRFFPFTSAIRFDGTMENGRRLGRGRYSAAFRARDSFGARSRPVRRAFDILKPLDDSK